METSKKFRRTILVVDDEAVNREMLGEILSQHYNIVFAEGGKEALAKINSLRERISLILLDLLRKTRVEERDLRTLLRYYYDEEEVKSVSAVVKDLLSIYFSVS